MFNKLKQAFGVQTVKVDLEIPTMAEKAGTALSGTVRLTAQSDQMVEDISLRLTEKYSTGRGSEKRTREFDLGRIKLTDSFELKSGDVKEIMFTLPYQARKSGNDQLKAHGGALGAIGKLGSMIEAETATYRVVAALSVKGAIISPVDSKEIQLV